MKKFAEKQPKHGETVMTCGHLEATVSYFFEIEGGPVKFRRPDGSMGEGKWVVLCNDCFFDSLAERKTPDQYVRHDAIWQGDEPIIMEDSKPN